MTVYPERAFYNKVVNHFYDLIVNIERGHKIRPQAIIHDD